MNKQKRVNFLLQRTNRNQIQQNFHSFTMMVHCFCLWLSWLKFEFNQWILGLFLELTMLPWSKFSVVITVNWRYIMNCVLCTMNCISINFSDFIHFRAVCLFLYQFRNFKIVYRRYAGLYFCFCVDVHDNNLYYLEAIHNFVEVRARNISSSRIIIIAHKMYIFFQTPGWPPKVTWPISRPYWCLGKILSTYFVWVTQPVENYT